MPTFMGKDDALRVMDVIMLAIYAVTYFHHRKLITCFGFPLITDIEYSTRLMKHNIRVVTFAMNNNINISCLFNEGTYISLTVIVP
jgi:hypothetical protein